MDNNKNNPTTVRSQLLKAAKDIPFIEHDQKMPGQNYTFMSEAALLKVVRPILLKHDILIYPALTPDYNLKVITEQYTTARGITMNMVTMERCFVIMHPPSDTLIRIHAVGQGSDAGDKAAQKAMTSSLKYALRQALLIPTGDDPDYFSSEDEGVESINLEEYMPPDATPQERRAWKARYDKAMETFGDHETAREEADQAYESYLESKK